MGETNADTRSQEIAEVFERMGLATQEEREKFTRLARPDPWNIAENEEEPAYLITNKTVLEDRAKDA